MLYRILLISFIFPITFANATLQPTQITPEDQWESLFELFQRDALRSNEFQQKSRVLLNLYTDLTLSETLQEQTEALVYYVFSRHPQSIRGLTQSANRDTFLHQLARKAAIQPQLVTKLVGLSMLFNVPLRDEGAHQAPRNRNRETPLQVFSALGATINPDNLINHEINLWNTGPTRAERIARYRAVLKYAIPLKKIEKVEQVINSAIQLRTIEEETAENHVALSDSFAELIYQLQYEADVEFQNDSGEKCVLIDARYVTSDEITPFYVTRDCPPLNQSTYQINNSFF